MTCLEMYECLGLMQKNILYFGRTEENNGNEVQNKLRVNKENMGFPDPFWTSTVPPMAQQPLVLVAAQSKA